MSAAVNFGAVLDTSYHSKCGTTVLENGPTDAPAVCGPFQAECRHHRPRRIEQRSVGSCCHQIAKLAPQLAETPGTTSRPQVARCNPRYMRTGQYPAGPCRHPLEVISVAGHCYDIFNHRHCCCCCCCCCCCSDGCRILHCRCRIRRSIQPHILMMSPDALASASRSSLPSTRDARVDANCI